MNSRTAARRARSWTCSDLWTVAAAIVLPFGWVLVLPRLFRFLR